MTDDTTINQPHGGPPGLVLRPYAGEQDAAIVTRILNAELEFEGLPFREAAGDVAARYRHASEMFDPARDLNVAEIDGQPVAYAERSWVDTSDGVYREYRIDGAVLPEWRRRGIGSVLLAENERRQRALAATHQTERQRVLGSWTGDRMDGAIALLSGAGFEHVRWFFEMTRPLDEPIPVVPLPDGLEIRPVTLDGVRQVWQADVEAFQDHWGGFDSSDAQLKRWIERPGLDLSLWVVAYEGDEVAGASINAIEAEENEMLGVRRGWLHSIFTRRQWRKRGLATALIAHSLTLLKERGMDIGILGVDADNPSGALGVYERIGFRVAERSTAWRRPLAP